MLSKTSSFVISPQTTFVSGDMDLYKSARCFISSLATNMSIPASLKYVSPIPALANNDKEHEADNSSVDTDENEVIIQNGNDKQTLVASNTQNETFFEKYQALQQQNPAYVIAYRLGDFYEILGDKAVEISREIDLTLTSRDCGLQKRVPLVGFPYHAAEIYFNKVSDHHDILVVETNGQTRIISKTKPERQRIVDVETGEILSDENTKPDNAVYDKLFDIFGNTLEVK